ncbi:MAG: prenyltransferase [Deltaproteobacteria bacterium]|nr:prenyltransferase [Deltaproteobacteria bacterium]MBZ0220057.1 prenyltransferase [Deltaproteobacteria bacterium]
MATRPQFLPATAVAVGLGASAAWHEARSFDMAAFALSMLAALLCHSGMNTLNDYYDSKNGADDLNRNALTPFTGGSRLIQRGLMTQGETLALGTALVAAGGLTGAYLALTVSPVLFVIGLLGVASGYFYSAPPLFLAGRGLGELTVGLTFGLLTVLGAFVAQTGSIGLGPVIASLPLSFLIAAILFVNEFPDFEADRAAGKRTLVVRLEPQRARWGLVFLLAMAYASIVAGVFLGPLPSWSLSALITALIAIPGALCLLKNYDRARALTPAVKAMIAIHLFTGLLQIASNLV